MPSRVKKSQLSTNQGQAVVEYVLILIISVSLVLGLMTAVFKPFGEFISNYMGKYVGCLLEYGELPTLGNATPAGPDEDSECDKKFQAASMTGGRPPNGNNSNGDGSSGSKDSKGSNSSDSGSSSSKGTYAGSDSRGGSSYIGNGRRAPRGVESRGDTRDGKVIEITADFGPENGYFKSSSGPAYTRPARKTSSVGLSGLTEEERKKLEKKAEGSSKTLSTGEGLAIPAKKIAVKKPEPKPQIEEDKPFTIGNFIRYLFIAALVIALVIFIGGQALQMSKNMEK